MSIQPEKPSSTDERLQTLRIEPGRKLPKRGVLASIFLVFLGLLIGLVLALVIKGAMDQGTAKAAAKATATAAETKAKPSAADAKVGDVILTATGYVTPRRRIALSPQVMGIVTWVGIEKGDRVEKDQELVRLENDEYKARLAQAEAQAASAKARLDLLLAGTRKEDLDRTRADVAEMEATLAQWDKTLERVKISVLEMGTETRQRLDEAQGARDAAAARLASMKAALDKLVAGARKEEIDTARADHQAAVAAAEEARIQMDDTIIRAPSAGTILEKLIEVGELVSPQNFGGTRGARTELLSLADLGDLQVEVDINESDFQKIRMGNPAKVVLDAYPTSPTRPPSARSPPRPTARRPPSR
jgi:HlyD family secretion protein